jgi:alkylated DNA repair protein alkB family protein 7
VYVCRERVERRKKVGVWTFDSFPLFSGDCSSVGLCSLIALSLLDSSYRAMVLSRLCLRSRSFSSSASASAPTAIDLSSTSSPFLDLSRFPPSLLRSLSIAPTDFIIYPDLLDEREQQILLSASLQKLDNVCSESRRARREWKRRQGRDGLRDMGGLLPEEAYAFQREHFDGVIEWYREATVSSWPEPKHSTREELERVLAKIYGVFPAESDEGAEPNTDGLDTPPRIIAHALHLASNGYIDPHVDNVEASGSVIAGVSLGSERVMHMQAVEDASKDAGGGTRKEIDGAFSFLLSPGSLYLQR